MALSSEMDLAKMSRGIKPDVKYFIRDHFGHEEFVQQVSYPIDQEIVRRQKELVAHSKDSANHFIEIRQIKVPNVVSVFYEQLDPFVIIHECDFYSKKVYDRVKARYHKLVSNLDSLATLWHSVCMAHMALRVSTGFVSNDISGNNILVGQSFNDFKIIDVLSLRYHGSNTLDPVRFFLTNKYPKHEKDAVLMDFFNGKRGIEKILKSLESLPTHSI